jgi:hypothetical protein
MRSVLTRAAIRRGGDAPSGQRPLWSRWPWALASIGLVCLLLLAAVLTHTLVSHGRQSAAAVPAPSIPAMNAVAVAHPEGGATLVALDGGNSHLVALTAPREPNCPPAGQCPPSPSPDSFAVLDGASGATLATTPLTADTAPAAHAVALLADATRHLAYALASDGVVIFSTENGARVGGFGLPADLAGSGVVAAALDPQSAALYVTNGQSLDLVDAASGQERAQQGLPVDNGSGAALVDGPIFDGARGRVYLLIQSADLTAPPALVAYDAHDLRMLGRFPLPVGTRLGPQDAAGANVYAFGADGSAWRIGLDGLAALGSMGEASGQTAQLSTVPALRNVLALGENPALGHEYAADAGSTRVISSADGRTLVALPLPARWPPSTTLLVDCAHSRVYLPADHGALVIVQDTQGGAGPLSAPAATLLARAALATLLPDTNQDPPFVTPATFPVQPGTRANDFWIHFGDRGWTGPYPGQASMSVAPLPGSAGAYRVTYSISWYQLFPHTHTWTLDISPDGGVRVASTSGDIVP